MVDSACGVQWFHLCDGGLTVHVVCSGSTCVMVHEVCSGCVICMAVEMRSEYVLV